MLDRVPYEIFRKIIKWTYAHDSFTTPTFNFGGREISSPPVKATHVCRSWRIALLSDPSMWTCIVFTDRIRMHPDELKEMLSRSGSALLDVLIDQRYDLLEPHLMAELDDMLSVISQEMHRCKQLQINIATELVPLVSRCLSQPVPMLQKFYLEVIGNDDDIETRDTLKKIHKTLFSGDASNMKYIRVQIPAGLDDLRLSLFHLTSLHLRFMSDTVIDGDILLGIFQSSSCLRILDVLWSRPSEVTVLSVPSNHRIPLPCLQELTLQGSCSIEIVDLVVGHLDFPTENVKFDITCEDSLSKISDSMPLSHFLTRRRLTFLFIYSDDFQLNVEFSEKDPRLPDSRFQATCRHTRARTNQLSEFLRRFNTSDITDVTLGGFSLRSAVLRGIFVSLRNLQYLHLSCHVHPDEVLGITFGPSIPGRSLKALTPRLRRSNTEIDASSESEDDITDHELNIEASFPCPSLDTLELLLFYDGLRLDEAYFRALVRCYRIRRQAGYPIKFITNCFGNLALAQGIKAWLQAHEGFPIEVRSSE